MCIRDRTHDGTEQGSFVKNFLKRWKSLKGGLQPESCGGREREHENFQIWGPSRGGLVEATVDLRFVTNMAIFKSVFRHTFWIWFWTNCLKLFWLIYSVMVWFYVYVLHCALLKMRWYTGTSLESIVPCVFWNSYRIKWNKMSNTRIVP